MSFYLWSRCPCRSSPYHRNMRNSTNHSTEERRRLCLFSSTSTITAGQCLCSIPAKRIWKGQVIAMSSSVSNGEIEREGQVEHSTQAWSPWLLSDGHSPLTPSPPGGKETLGREARSERESVFLSAPEKWVTAGLGTSGQGTNRLPSFSFCLISLSGKHPLHNMTSHCQQAQTHVLTAIWFVGLGHVPNSEPTTQ